VQLSHQGGGDSTVCDLGQTNTTVNTVGDVNMDGSVNVLDMISVGQHWGEIGIIGWIRQDINQDGTINVLDMIVMGQHWTG